MALRTQTRYCERHQLRRLAWMIPCLAAGFLFVLIVTGVWPAGNGEDIAPLLFAFAAFGNPNPDALRQKPHRGIDDDRFYSSFLDRALLTHLQSIFQLGLMALDAKSVSLTLWDRTTGHRIEWTLHRDNEFASPIESDPEPCLQPDRLDIGSAVFIRKGTELSCRGTDGSGRAIRNAALLEYLRQSWHGSFQTLLLASLQVGARWRGTLGYVDAPVSIRPDEDLRRLRQIVATATSGENLYQITSEARKADERRRIARDLHDGVTQSLIATELRIAALDRATADIGNMRAGLLADVRESLRQEIRKLRLQMQELQSGSTHQGIREKLQQIVTEFAQETQIATTYHCDLAQASLSPQMGFELSCLLAEALSNVRRHSQAKAVAIHLDLNDGVYLNVHDDGCGFEFSGCYGLQSLLRMQRGPRAICERVQELAGDLTLESSPDGGTGLQIWIPLSEAEHACEDAARLYPRSHGRGFHQAQMRKPPQTITNTSRRLRSV